MNRIPFCWAGGTSIGSELVRPLSRISAEFVIPKSGPRFVTLWRTDGSGLRIFTEMHDLAERCEVGVLKFEPALRMGSSETVIELSAPFRGGVSASKLLIDESGAVVESGIVLESRMGDEIAILAGVYPYSLAIQGAVSLPFDSEYPLEQYRRERLG